MINIFGVMNFWIFLYFFAFLKKNDIFHWSYFSTPYNRKSQDVTQIGPNFYDAIFCIILCSREKKREREREKENIKRKRKLERERHTHTHTYTHTYTHIHTHTHTHKHMHTKKHTSTCWSDKISYASCILWNILLACSGLCGFLSGWYWTKRVEINI